MGYLLTWYSMLGSYRLFRHMAQVSVQMAQDHMATAFHFFISNLFAGAAFPLPLSSPFEGPGTLSTSIASTSACIQNAGKMIDAFEHSYSRKYVKAISPRCRKRASVRNRITSSIQCLFAPCFKASSALSLERTILRKVEIEL